MAHVKALYFSIGELLDLVEPFEADGVLAFRFVHEHIYIILLDHVDLFTHAFNPFVIKRYLLKAFVVHLQKKRSLLDHFDNLEDRLEALDLIVSWLYTEDKSFNLEVDLAVLV